MNLLRFQIGAVYIFAGLAKINADWLLDAQPMRIQLPVRMRDYVTERQEKMMAQDPFMVRALARHIAADLRARGVAAGVEVRADSFAALNGRPVQRLIDPSVDLAAPAPPEWIVPLKRDHRASADDGWY